MSGRPEITEVPAEAGSSDPEGTDTLVPLLYEELHALAHQQLRRFRPGQTLCTTALIHEAYLKLADQGQPRWKDRNHFLAVASMAMRQVVVDHARKRQAQKRGAGAAHMVLDHGNGEGIPIDAQADALVQLDDALNKLAALNRRLVRVVELRFFGGLSVEEAADVLQTSSATVKRDTRVARAFLYREIAPPDEPPSG